MSDPLGRLERDRTALVVIDVQEKLLGVIEGHARVLRGVRLLLRAADVLGLATVVTTQNRARLGEVVGGVRERVPRGALELDKTAFSCFDDDRFERELRAAAPRATALLVCGIEAHICVAGSVLGALRSGYRVEVAADAVGSRAAADAAVGLARMERAGAYATTSEMAVYGLLGRADTPEFRALLPALKE